MYKRPLAIMSLMLSLLWLTGCAGLGTIFQREAAPVSISEKIISKKTPAYKLELKYPAIQGMENATFQSGLNKEIEKYIKTDIASFQSNAEQAYRDGVLPGPYEMVSTYRVHTNQPGILSLTVEMYSFTGGAHGMTYRKSFNVDTTHAKRLSLKDLFTPNYNYRAALTGELNRQIAAQPDNFFPETVSGLKTVPSDQPFYLESKNLVLYYGLYDIAPYAAGFPEFKIPYTFFKDNLVLDGPIASKS